MSKTSEQQPSSKRLKTPASYKPGQSGNPKGAPKKGTSVAELLRKKANRTVLQGAYKGKTYAEAIAEVLLAKAIDGDLKATDMLYDRTDGKPHQTIAQTNETRAEIVVLGGPQPEGGE